MRAEVCSEDGRIHEGTTIVQHVALGPLPLEAAVRVVRVWRSREGDADEVGFTYATLNGHPERGISTFRIRRSNQDQNHLPDRRPKPARIAAHPPDPGLARVASNAVLPRPLCRTSRRPATDRVSLHAFRAGPRGRRMGRASGRRLAAFPCPPAGRSARPMPLTGVRPDHVTVAVQIPRPRLSRSRDRGRPVPDVP